MFLKMKKKLANLPITHKFILSGNPNFAAMYCAQWYRGLNYGEQLWHNGTASGLQVEDPSLNPQYLQLKDWAAGDVKDLCL